MLWVSVSWFLQCEREKERVCVCEVATHNSTNGSANHCR